MKPSKYRKLYLDYVNNYITVRCFAEHNRMTPSSAERVIALGRFLHENYVQTLKNNK